MEKRLCRRMTVAYRQFTGSSFLSTNTMKKQTEYSGKIFFNRGFGTANAVMHCSISKGLVFAATVQLKIQEPLLRIKYQAAPLKDAIYDICKIKCSAEPVLWNNKGEDALNGKT